MNDLADRSIDPDGPVATPGGLGSLDPVLIANRGEIAVRVAQGAHRLGLGTVAVYTDADAGALHCREAETAVRVGSYLDPGAIVEAALRVGARSVHPGYGFLSENAAFARAVRDAGLVWIGPPPVAIELMGDKARSKELAAEADVPVIPGTEGADTDADAIRALGAEHRYPLLIKAVAGGGGKGMRVVESDAEVEQALEAARSEGEKSFGDSRVLAELYLERPRHIEVQVLADRRGNAMHVGERECSLQRRHQKVIEEAPSAALDPRMRERMGAAAVRLAEACDYEGAGTVEFITGSDADEFFFLEMNTRLQVEHPVTELVWGVDLVEQQLRIAAGETLALELPDEPQGHAVEARLYAEDPASGFLPSTGEVRHLRLPQGEGVRVDSGIAPGSVIGSSYDPMLAKVIAHGPDREIALARLDRALADLELLGVSTNAGFSRALLADPDVRAGSMDTGMLERRLEDLVGDVPADLPLAAAVARFEADVSGSQGSPGPWLRSFDELGEVRIEGDVIRTPAGEHEFGFERLGAGRIAIELDGVRRRYAVAVAGDSVWIGRAGHQHELRVARSSGAGAAARGGSLEAPMPGTVLRVEVGDGERVTADQVLMVLESMKMELQITAPHDGLVSGLELEAGAQVAVGDPLLAVEADDSGEDASGAGAGGD